MTSPCIFPTLRYRDADAAIRWLTQVAGFRDHAVYRADDGAVAHAELALGVSIIMVGQARDDAYGAMIGDGKRTEAIYVAVPDADAVFARAQASGVAIERAPYDTDYGSREFACRDPEGNLWSFGTYWPKTTDQI
ncbi:VOC family protein [uncultured Paracoccus sp.]|uniref:VOC family protein n=1 Tax=uncultured Paracoccus sp. TaxID=189685 RepID=UPI0025FAEC8A|nr:VOC family protein [uncultured Paracoccus sp.]